MMYFWLPLLLVLAAAWRAPAAVLSLHDGARIHPPEPALPEGFMYWGTSDTTLDPAAPDADFGGAGVVRLAPGGARILVRFDQLLPALGGPFVTVRAARLTLHLAAPDGPPGDLSRIAVFRVRRSWNEGGLDGVPNYLAATYRSRYHGAPGAAIAWAKPGASGADARPLRGANVSYDHASRTLAIDGLAPDINDYLQRHYEHCGWLIMLPGGRGAPPLAFHSREATDPALRPALVLDYAPVPPAPPALDLGVVHIERYPEYFAWKDANSYEQKKFRGVDVGILKHPEFMDVQKHPAPGDMLQYVGVVKNHGSRPITSFAWRWRVNDTTVKTGVYTEVLPPQQQAYLWFSHPCPSNCAEHRDEWLTLRVEPREAVPENKHNNELTIFTKARATGVHCDETSRAFYQSNYNAFGTYCFEDWIQFQLLYWNQIYMAKSRVRNLFPDGSHARVRLQRAEFYRDGDLTGPVHVAFDWRTPRYDGLWGWDFGALKDKTEMDKPGWFFRRTLRMCEPSLIHEMSHQCFGLMDIYWMTMEPAKDAATGSGGKITLRDPRNPSRFITGIGYWPKYSGLMGGGDTRYTPQHEGTTLYADHDLCGLNQNAACRGGFFGDYLYGIQTSITVRLIAEDGTPAAGARVCAWQSTYWTGDNVIDDSKLVFSNLLTDARGELLLPNQSTLENGPVTLLTGHTLRDNPFGRIHVCGFNGNLLLHAEYRGRHYYYMIMVWEQNVRFARGARDTDTRVWQLGPHAQLGTYQHVY